MKDTLPGMTPDLAAEIDAGLALMWFVGEPHLCPSGIERANWAAPTAEASTMLTLVIIAIRARSDHLREIGATGWNQSRLAPRLVLWITDEVAHGNTTDVEVIAKTGRAVGVNLICATEMTS